MGSWHWGPPSSFLPNTVYESGSTPKEHHAEDPITVAVLEGAFRFKARGDERVLHCDGLLTFGEAIQHEVEALEETCGPPDHISLTARFGAC